ncbi:MAG: type II secretion system protein [Planctomycetota bacterium]|nr:type II secretion system protein [Planctomycetota bacterium]
MRTCHRAWARRASAGMTMIELIVATVIFSLLIAMAFQISMNTTRSASEKIVQATVEVKAERTLKLVTDELISASSLAPVLATNGSSITVQVPHDNDGDGTTVSRNSNFSLELGAVTDAGKLANGTVTYTFVRDRTISEASENLDLNLDGDTNDTFDVGYLQRTSTVSGDIPVVVGVTNIIQRRNNYGASILADSNPSTDTSGRIFTRNADGTLLQISFWLLSVSEDRNAHLVQSKVQLFLRNR